MIQLHEEYVVDETGNRKAVLIPISEWNQIVELLEELEDIQAYDAGNKHPSEPTPFGLNDLRK